MIEVTKQVRNLASLTGALSELVEAVEKINGIEQYEAEAKARIKAMQDEAEKWNVEAYQAKLKADELSKQAADIIAVAKDEAEEIVSAASIKADLMASESSRVLHEAKDNCLAMVRDAEAKVAAADKSAADAIAKRQAEEEKLSKIQEAIKKITG